MNKVLAYLFVLVTTSFTFVIDTIYGVSEFYFYAIIIFLLIDYLERKKLVLIHVWISGFIFIILSEALVNYNELADTTNFGLLAVKLLIIANNFILLGYFSLKEVKIVRYVVPSKTSIVSKKNALFNLVLILVLYISIKLPEALQSFNMGRIYIAQNRTTDDSEYVIGNIISALGMLLPAVIAYYFRYYNTKRSKLWIALLVMPVFIILFISGTRFPLLFAFLGFVLIYRDNLEIKKSFLKKNYIGVSLALLFLLSLGMKSFRADGFSSQNFSLFSNHDVKELKITSVLASNMSPEGIIDMTALMIDYFKKNNHLYGKSTSFITYFWVPRVVWEDKPTMLGYWFIREYRSGFSVGHSASFGFFGDFYADFGILGLGLVFIMGILIKKAENFQEVYLQSVNYKRVLAAMLFAYIFFIVRSPITATINFLGIIFFYYLLKYLLFKEVKRL